MSVPSVFVYEDGQVGLMDLTCEVAVISRLLRVPFTASVAPLESEAISIPRIDYRLRGHMFDGRPIYCAPGFDVREALISGYVSVLGIDRLDTHERREIRKFVKRECPQGIELDEWVGSSAGPHENHELEAQCLAKRGVRLLYATRE